ncbi:MAG: hypothetical protein BGO03_14165 [Mesorhizobium sp. 61-13]|nr:MAG: hypothetical protein BGO03_14165 [Mesorhizobium sp. 61-13]
MDPGHSFLASLESEFRDDEAEESALRLQVTKWRECAFTCYGDRPAGRLEPNEVGSTHGVIPEANRTK